MVDFVSDDTGSKFVATCRDANDTVIDLTGATANLKWNDEEGTLVSKAMTIESPPTDGKVSYTFLTGELFDPGMSLEIELTLPGGTIVRNPDLIVVSVRGKLV